MVLCPLQRLKEKRGWAVTEDTVEATAPEKNELPPDKIPNPVVWRWLLCTPVLGIALWRLFDAWQLQFGPAWSYYLKPPNIVLWLLVLCAALAGLRHRTPWGVVKAGTFVFAVTFLWIMPPERGADVAHPDHFLAYEVDRISNQLWTARKNRTLPQHPLDLRTQMMADIEFSYRHRDQATVSLRVDVTMNANGPVTAVADRPGVVHVAVENGGQERIWIRATGLGGYRFGAPAFIVEPEASSPATVVVRNPRRISPPTGQPHSPIVPPKHDGGGQTPAEDGGPD